MDARLAYETQKSEQELTHKCKYEQHSYAFLDDMHVTSLEHESKSVVHDILEVRTKSIVFKAICGRLLTLKIALSPH